MHYYVPPSFLMILKAVLTVQSIGKLISLWEGVNKKKALIPPPSLNPFRGKKREKSKFLTFL